MAVCYEKRLNWLMKNIIKQRVELVGPVDQCPMLTRVGQRLMPKRAQVEGLEILPGIIKG